MTQTTTTSSSGFTRVIIRDLMESTQEFINKYRSDFEALATKE